MTLDLLTDCQRHNGEEDGQEKQPQYHRARVAAQPASYVDSSAVPHMVSRAGDADAGGGRRGKGAHYPLEVPCLGAVDDVSSLNCVAVLL